MRALQGSMVLTLALADEAATETLGRRLAELARAGDVIALEGPLGAGKTTLARSFIRSLTDPAEEVPSPTFTLVQTYRGRSGAIAHFDLFRLTRADEALELGIEEAYADGIVLIEWPERLGGALPARRLALRLEPGTEDDARTATLESPAWAGRLARLAAA